MFFSEVLAGLGAPKALSGSVGCAGLGPFQAVNLFLLGGRHNLRK